MRKNGLPGTNEVPDEDEKGFDDNVWCISPKYFYQSGQACFANLAIVSSADTETTSLANIPWITGPASATRINPGKTSLAEQKTVSFADTKNPFPDENPLIDPSITFTIRIDGTEPSIHDMTQEDTINPNDMRFGVGFEDNPEDRPLEYGWKLRIV